MLEPMLASLADAPLDDPNLVYEPKYDGIRAIVEVGDGDVRLWSRLGNEKTAQFPEIAAALKQWARRLKAPLVLDGEIVALDDKGNPAGFQNLQGRIHLQTPTRPARPDSVRHSEGRPNRSPIPAADGAPRAARENRRQRDAGHPHQPSSPRRRPHPAGA